jgi:Ecdysteroid kinase-like family
MLGDDKGFLSSVVRLSLEYDQLEPQAPNSVVVKIEPEEETFQKLGDELHAFQREIRFYKEVANSAPIRLPRLYFSVDEPPAYCMIMEDLSAFTPGDQIMGMHEQQVLTTVESIAKLQAKFWNNDTLQQLQWMPTSNSVSDDYPEKWESFIKYFGEIAGKDGLQVGKKLVSHISWLKESIENRPKTLVHSDLREDNLLFGTPGSESEVIIIDWQLTIRSMGAFDVARVMDGSELPSERKGHHFNVLRWWHDTLIREGVRDYSWDDAQYDLRLAALNCLTYPVHFHDAFIGSEGRSLELANVLISRHFSSVVEIDAASVLP